MANAGKSGSVAQRPPAGRRVLTGALDDVDIFSIAQFLVIQRKTGVLTISFGDAQSNLWFENGQIVSGRVPGAQDGPEAVRRIFRWKQGTFEFAPATEKAPALITTDAQSLLMDLAIEADEMSRIIPASQAAPPPVKGPASSVPPVRPAVARVVRPATPPPPPLVARVGALPASQASAQPQYRRLPFSQDEFVRQIEERLVIEDTEFISAPRHTFLHPERRSAPPHSLHLVLFGVGIPVVLIVAGLIAWLATSTSTPVTTPPPRPPQPAMPSPPVVKEHKFVTAPNSPARPIEKCIANLALQCDLQGLDFDRKDVRQVNVVIVREAFWNKNELFVAVAQDSLALVQRIFDTQPVYLERVCIIARSRLSGDLGQNKLDDVFRMTATRSAYESIRPTYSRMSEAKIIEKFGGRFDKRLLEP